MTMKLKTVEVEDKEGNKQTYALVQNGMPVYDQDGKDIPFDAEHATNKIASLNHEAQTHRSAKEEAEANLAKFEGIDDPAAARKAMETVANLDNKDLVEAGKVDEIKTAAIAAVEEKMANAIKAKDLEIESLKNDNKKLSTSLDNELIGGNFSRSKYVEDKINIPADILQAQFGRHFKVEDGKLNAYHGDGSPVYSRERPGEKADFEEALEILVDGYPHKDSILKGTQNRGTGAQTGSGSGGDKTIPRSEFDKLQPTQQRAKVMDGFTVVDT